MLFAQSHEQITKMLQVISTEKGFVGLKSYEENPLGSAAQVFNEM